MSNSRKLAYLANLIGNTGTIPITTISDIEISSAASSQALIYDNVSGKWKNSTINISSTGTSDQVNTSTGFFMIPSGTTAQRPASPQYGALRYNTTTGLAEVYSPNGWSVFGTPPPQISSITPGTYNGESGTAFTVNGAYFTSDLGVKFVDVNNVEYNAATITLVNSSTLTITTPQDFTVAQGPLDVKIIQSSGIAIQTDCISTGGTPSWTTTSGQIGGTIYRNGSVSTNVAATDPDTNATITYSVYSGTLPTGLSLNAATGAITGTAPNVGSDTTYNFTLRATDNAGNTADRAFSMIILQGSPAAPTIGTVTRSASQSVQVTFTAPANVGGSAISSYTVTSSPGGLTASGATGPITVTGLTNGTSYTFTVTATNSYGTSVASSASNSAIPSTTASAPTIGTATFAGGSSATVSFTAPNDNGGGTITSYTAVSSPNGITGSISQAGSGTITVNNLPGNTDYTFIVYATNAAGNSSSSAASNSINVPLPAPTSVEYLVVAGGGGGGGGNGGGGGGAGGMLDSTVGVSANTAYTVTVGAGGPSQQANGSGSQFYYITTVGGGAGVGENGPESGNSGGSGGGGGSGWRSNKGGGSGTGGQGNNGGSGMTGDPYRWGGGGGGAGQAGTSVSENSGGQPGGNGRTSSITGSSTYYAGGGGGGSYHENQTWRSGGSGGAGGGGAGGVASYFGAGVDGSANTGGGGGGGGWSYDWTSRGGAAGGSGVVIIAYSSSYKPLASIDAGLSYDQPGRSGYRVYRFYSGTGNISW